MPTPLLNRRQQTAVATLLLVLLALGAATWLLLGAAGPHTIDIDRAERPSYQFLVDVNTAEWPELAQLPDIGEVLARRIVATRQSRGPFGSTDELLEVHGIGPRKLARIAPYLIPIADPTAVAGTEIGGQEPEG